MNTILSIIVSPMKKLLLKLEMALINWIISEKQPEHKSVFEEIEARRDKVMGTEQFCRWQRIITVQGQRVKHRQMIDVLQEYLTTK